MPIHYDAILIVSFGGPEGPDEVIPFLENVLRGKHVPRERMLEVAEHYQHFGGVSPINEQNRNLISALELELSSQGPVLPVYWGNRNWHPMLSETVKQMANDGVRHALAFVTSAFSSYSGCRQYREDIQRAQACVGPHAPSIDKLRVFFNHPGFIEPMVQRVSEALQQFSESDRDQVHIAFTAHSIPAAMANGCDFQMQLDEACRLVSGRLGIADWRLVYQSRSGPPTQPWLEPDICDHIRAVHETEGVRNLVIVPIGFISDHMEVLFDLDTEAKAVCDELNICMLRAKTVGSHPRFVTAIRELVMERLTDNPVRQALGCLGPSHDVCPSDCCLSGRPLTRAT